MGGEFSKTDSTEIKNSQIDNFKKIESGMMLGHVKKFWDKIFEGNVGKSDVGYGNDVSKNKETFRELTNEEKQHIKDRLGWSDDKIKKCTVNENGIINFKTDRCDLEGKSFDNGVPFERRTIDINGVKVEGVFPVFKSVFDIKLSPGEYKSNTYAKLCNAELKEKVEADKKLKEKFNTDQLNDIKEGRTPTGYVWHHNEEPGKMQLVRREDHDKTIGGAPHTGGSSLWGPDSADTSRKGERF